MAKPAKRHSARRILVVRNDKLGDFMLAWPALACLKQAQPANHIAVLVPEYTAILARACPWVNEVIVDPGDGAGRTAQSALLARMRAGNYDALLTLFSTPRIGWLGLRSGIELRMAPATKWAQVFHNHRVVQRRSRSIKPEYQYNLDLAEALLERLGQARPQLGPPYWPLAKSYRRAQRARLAEELAIDPRRPWLFLHGGNGGSAANLSPSQYAALAVAIERLLPPQVDPQWLLTAGAHESGIALALRDDLWAHHLDTAIVPPRQRLDDFALGLAAADLLIAGSTGPLHVAGCLNIPTAGFYPAKRSSTALRWQTCNSAAKRLAFSAPRDSDMAAIDLDAAACEIAAMLARITPRSQPSESPRAFQPIPTRAPPEQRAG